ncbi:TraR/DksA family transcriptional regulator [Mesobacterium pallidum]|uniref:TraR/DksA family transcriptional regulator n=1 Tax=Mesobacterium pallidum TaxID=2872037 RepID=UPI001EE1C6A2|nr:TraR/DksA C4-type zinc finger protein [Mesobacterium pallidum]
MPDTAKFRDRLLSRLGELDSRLQSIETQLDEPHLRDWEEDAVEREGDEVLESLGQAGQDEIRRIRAALGRIRDGSYGLCARCGDAISQARLEVLPDTPFCKACAAAH